MVSSSSSNYSKKLLPLISWSHWFTFFNIVAAVLLSSFYVFSDPAPETFIGGIYLVTNWLSHMGFLTFISFVLIIFPIILIYPRTNAIRTISSVIFTLGLLLLLLDALVYNQLGYHLNASSSDQIIQLVNTIIDRDKRLFWFATIVSTLSILAFQFVMSNYAWKHLRALQKTVIAKYFVHSMIATFFVSHFIHIWADAKLEYDILKQDTMFPVSYPTTAKALLTKYGLFNREDYIQRKTSPLALNDELVNYPQLSASPLQHQCDNLSVQNSTFVVLTSGNITKEQLTHFSQRSSQSSYLFTKHVDNAVAKSSWFNLFYSLPSIYQSTIDQQQVKPVLMQLLEQNNLSASFTHIAQKTETDFEYAWLFNTQTKLKDISSLVFAKKLNSYALGVHVLYFDDVNTYQFELFVDALLLAQKHKQHKDVIWVSSLGSNNEADALTTKHAMLVTPSTRKKVKSVKQLTSHYDVQNTLTHAWLNCSDDKLAYGNGENLLSLKQARIIANTTDNGIVVFSKDQSVLIDQNSNFTSYSSQLNTPITVNADFPLMIDGVNFIKKFNHNRISH